MEVKSLKATIIEVLLDLGVINKESVPENLVPYIATDLRVLEAIPDIIIE